MLERSNGTGDNTITIDDVSDGYLQPYLDALNDVTTKSETTTSTGSSSHSSSSAAAASTIRAVVMKVLSDVNIYNGYDEIKYCISSSCTDDKLLGTLDLFSYGTYQDYIQQTTASTYIQLNDTQLTKLKQLSVLQLLQSTCSQKKNCVSYTDIATTLLQLSVNSTVVSEIESIVATLVASKVVVGRLSQKQQGFIISRLVRTRDVHPNMVSQVLLPSIQSIQTKLQESIQSIQYQQQSIVDQLNETHQQQNETFIKQQQILNSKQRSNETLSSSSGTSFLGIGSTYIDPMDVDYAGVTSPEAAAAAAAAAASRRQKRARGGLGQNNNLFST